MGATAAIVGLTLLSGGYTMYQQHETAKAEAKQQQQNANLMYANAQKEADRAYELAQNNAINQENKRRRLRQKMGTNINNIGASGLVAGGSNLNTLADLAVESEREIAIDAYNGRQGVDSLFQNQANYVNQGDVYTRNAKNIRKAGKRQMWATALKTGASLAMAFGGGGLGGGSSGSAGSISGSDYGLGPIDSSWSSPYLMG